MIQNSYLFYVKNKKLNINFFIYIYIRFNIFSPSKENCSTSKNLIKFLYKFFYC